MLICCSIILAPYLSQQTLDKSMFETMTDHRPGYKPPEISTTTVSSTPVATSTADQATFSVPTRQPPQSSNTTPSGEDKGMGFVLPSMSEAIALTSHGISDP